MKAIRRAEPGGEGELGVADRGEGVAALLGGGLEEDAEEGRDGDQPAEGDA